MEIFLATLDIKSKLQKIPRLKFYDLHLRKEPDFFGKWQKTILKSSSNETVSEKGTLSEFRIVCENSSLSEPETCVNSVPGDRLKEI